MNRICGYPRSNSLSQCRSHVERRIVEYQEKFFTTVSADDIACASTAFHAPRNAFEYAVTDQVAVIIVDILEVIEVCHCDRERPPMRERICQTISEYAYDKSAAT